MSVDALEQNAALVAALDAAFADAAMCRKVLDVEEKTGARFVEVRRLTAGAPPRGLQDVVAVTPALLQVRFDIPRDDVDHLENRLEEVEALVADAAAALGALEDELILQGFDPAIAAGAAVAVAPPGAAAPAPPAGPGRAVANPPAGRGHVALGCSRRWDAAWMNPYAVLAGAGAATPLQIVRRGAQQLRARNRHGSFSAILDEALWIQVSHVPAAAGAPSTFSELQAVLNSDRIIGSNGFEANHRAVVFRPSAAKLVVTEKPRIVVQRPAAGGVIQCVAQERVVLAVIDPTSIAVVI